jgi:ketosteroid isomerase-like protein
MTDEERKAVVLEYLHAMDGGGVTSDGRSILDLFADDARMYFPKWGLATGKEQIGRMFGDLGTVMRGVRHHYDSMTWVFSGGDLMVCEGTSDGEHVDGSWRAADRAWGGGRFCDVFEVRGGRIHRCFVYLDPDYAGKDTARYPWLARSLSESS